MFFFVFHMCDSVSHTWKSKEVIVIGEIGLTTFTATALLYQLQVSHMCENKGNHPCHPLSNFAFLQVQICFAADVLQNMLQNSSCADSHKKSRCALVKVVIAESWL